MSLDTLIRVDDFHQEDQTFLQPGVNRGGRIKILYSQGVMGKAASRSVAPARWELWRFPGHTYIFGLGLSDYAPTKYAIVRVWMQEFHFMGVRRPCKRLAGDVVVSVEPGRYWRTAARHMKTLIDGLSSLDPWPVPEKGEGQHGLPYTIEKMKAQLEYIINGGT